MLLQPGDIVGHLLAWTWHEHDGKWYAWVSWVQGTSARPVHKVVEVEARQLQPLEAPDAVCAKVPGTRVGPQRAPQDVTPLVSLSRPIPIGPTSP